MRLQPNPHDKNVPFSIQRGAGARCFVKDIAAFTPVVKDHPVSFGHNLAGRDGHLVYDGNLNSHFLVLSILCQKHDLSLPFILHLVA